MALWNPIKNICLDLLYPRQCVGCKIQDSWFCDHCASLIKKIEQKKCYICKKPHPEGTTCSEHFTERTLNKLLVGAHYSANPVLGDAIHEFKYNRHPEDIATKLGHLLSSTLTHHLLSSYSSCSFILIPVPLHTSRLKERGFNQAKLLADEVSKLHKIPLPDSNLLTRQKHTTSQVQSGTRQARLENLKDAFTTTKKADPNAIYILIDDVTTTGSTLEECCQVLRKAGAKEVWGLVLARN
ncbi:MAG: double zinc ribbon domain-containing protein [Candidatus Gracilibacteria bacterium]|nr:double zinc ribbon domain-containing protein [Candidatus Gracilibacteria bacterium]